MLSIVFLFVAVASCVPIFAVALPAGDASAKPHPLGGAGITCDNWQVVSNTADLEASCENDGGTFVQTRISISQCAGNQNGVIACQAK